MNPNNKRDRLVESAATLFHRKGMALTSLADIAKDADIPIGNVYYYFKTKDELALSALTLHKDQYIALFTTLEESTSDPRQRLKEMIAHFEKQVDDITRYGCPISKIVMDVEAGTPIANAASEVLQCMLGWLEVQMQELGHEQSAARAFATSLLCGMQGAAVSAKALQEPSLFLQELARLTAFVEHLPNKRIPLGKIGLKSSAA